jgi:hypothetical protein
MRFNCLQFIQPSFDSCHFSGDALGAAFRSHGFTPGFGLPAFQAEESSEKRSWA